MKMCSPPSEGYWDVNIFFCRWWERCELLLLHNMLCTSCAWLFTSTSYTREPSFCSCRKTQSPCAEGKDHGSTETSSWSEFEKGEDSQVRRNLEGFLAMGWSCTEWKFFRAQALDQLQNFKAQFLFDMYCKMAVQIQ